MPDAIAAKSIRGDPIRPETDFYQVRRKTPSFSAGI